MSSCVLRPLLCLCLWAGVGLGFSAQAEAASPEFDAPTSTRVPVPSAYNTTPSCPLSAANGWICAPPRSAWPPADSANPERYLNSAYWPAEKRPDIEENAIQLYGYSYKKCAAFLPHYCFLVDAEAVGYPVSHTPQVGDLWLAPGECLTWQGRNDGDDTAPPPAGCDDATNTDWYMGYVEQVLPGGGFIQSWGGSHTPADSGLELTQFSGAMDSQTVFIEFTDSLNAANHVHLTVYVTGGDRVKIDVGSTAPDSTTTLTGPRGETVTLDHGSSTVTLTAGRWRACAESGGPGTKFNPEKVCKSFSVVGPMTKTLLKLAALKQSAATDISVSASAAAWGQRANVIVQYRARGHNLGPRRTSMVTLASHGRLALGRIPTGATAVLVIVSLNSFSHDGVRYAGATAPRVYTLRH